MRISRQDLYIKIAELFSERSICGRLQVGCVIVKDGRIICTGYNGTLKTDRDPIVGGICKCNLNKPCTKAIHAEANCIAYAAKNGIALEDSVLYCTHSPCVKCSELIIQAGIKEVNYEIRFRETFGINLLENNLVNVNQIGEEQIQDN